MRIIDMRMRPPFGCFLEGVLYTTMEAKCAMASQRGVSISEAALQASMELTLQEMDANHIVCGVVPIRKTNKGRNEDLLALAAQYPGRFIGIPHIDPFEGDFALEEIDTYVLKGPCKGIIVEGASIFNKIHWFADDPRVFHVYEKCQKEGIPVLFTHGGRMFKAQEYLNPVHLDRLAVKFPDLRIVACHGAWPFVTQMCHVAVERPNVFISPEVFMMDFMPGHQEYLLAANYMLRDKMLFGTSFPSVSTKDAIAHCVSSLRPEVADMVLYQNAAKLFNIN